MINGPHFRLTLCAECSVEGLTISSGFLGHIVLYWAYHEFPSYPISSISFHHVVVLYEACSLLGGHLEQITVIMNIWNEQTQILILALLLTSYGVFRNFNNYSGLSEKSVWYFLWGCCVKVYLYYYFYYYIAIMYNFCISMYMLDALSSHWSDFPLSILKVPIASIPKC